MNWLARYRIRLYLRNSIWVFPAVSIVAGLVSLALLSRVEQECGWTTSVSVETARAIMSMVASSLFTLIALVCSAVLLAVQLASAQLTPRIIAIVYRNPFRKSALALFTFTFTFSVGVLARLEAGAPVPLLTGYLAAYGFLLNVALFLLFVDGIGKMFRPSSALRAVALIGREVIQSVYPRMLDGQHSSPPEPLKCLDEGPGRVVINEVDGAVLAFDVSGLVSLAERADCLVELVPEVGDFVAAGDPLFRVFPVGEGPPDDVLRACVAVGPERTLEQDPMFAFRIIVDIASKALSPAVNDPTTAVLAIDQIHHLLRHVGRRRLDDGQVRDARGEVRLIYRTPDWEDFVLLAVTEIRHFGASSIQITRRLRAMLENLIESLPGERAALLRQEMALLHRTVERTFSDPEDRARADAGDFQGVGGSFPELPGDRPAP